MADKYNFLNFTLVDFETTGLDPQNDQIIEAMVIRVRDGNPVMTFNTLVALREGKTIPPNPSHPHKDEDLIGGMDEERLAGIFAWMLPDDEMIVAYNALFDLSFIEALFVRHGYSSVTCNFLDPLTIARDREPYPHKLADVCKRNGIVLDNAHSAEADTFALLELVEKYHMDKDISEWVNVAGYRPKYGEPVWYPENAILKKQGAETVNHSSKAPAKKPLPKRVNTVTSNRSKKTPPPGDRAEDLP